MVPPPSADAYPSRHILDSIAPDEVCSTPDLVAPIREWRRVSPLARLLATAFRRGRFQLYLPSSRACRAVFKEVFASMRVRLTSLHRGDGAPSRCCQSERIVTPWKAYMARALELPVHVAAYKAAGVVLPLCRAAHHSRSRSVRSDFLAKSARDEFRWRVRVSIGPISPDYAVVSW